MLEHDDELNAHVGGRSPTASMLFASEGLLEVAAEFVEDGRPDVGARATLRAALLLEAAGHPAAPTIHSLRLDLEHPEGSENHDGPLGEVLRHEAFLVRREAGYLEAVAADPHQADAGSWIEARDHPHHLPDPWVERGATAAPERLVGVTFSERERWRDNVITKERGDDGRDASTSAAQEAARIAAQGQVPMRSSATHAAGNAAGATDARALRGAHASTPQVER